MIIIKQKFKVADFDVEKRNNRNVIVYRDCDRHF